MEQQLPNADLAWVPQAKVEDYLLNLEHPDGAPKAVFFIQFGFRRHKWEELQGALLEHCRTNWVVRVEERLGAVRYSVEGSLRAPDGRWPLVRSVWIIHGVETNPRLVTAYPLRRRNERA